MSKITQFNAVNEAAPLSTIIRVQNATTEPY